MIEKIILAHRGLSAQAPENTLAAFTKAANLGAEWIETDLGITADQHVVIIHDDFLDRTTSGTGLLTSLPYSEVAKLSAGAWYAPEFADERVPTLNEFFRFLGTTRINANLELKAVVADNANELADSLVRQTAAALDRLDPECKIIVSSKSAIMLLKLRQIRPQTQLAILFDQHSLRDDWRLTAQACGVQFIHPEAESLTRTQIKAFKDAGYRVNVWTINQLDIANKLFNWGVDGIFTNQAEMFLPKRDILPGVNRANRKDLRVIQ